MLRAVTETYPVDPGVSAVPPPPDPLLPPAASEVPLLLPPLPEEELAPLLEPPSSPPPPPSPAVDELLRQPPAGVAHNAKAANENPVPSVRMAKQTPPPQVVARPSRRGSRKPP